MVSYPDTDIDPALPMVRYNETEPVDLRTVLNAYLVSFADHDTWQVDEMGRSWVLWLEFPSDDHEQKSENEVKHGLQ